MSLMLLLNREFPVTTKLATELRLIGVSTLLYVMILIKQLILTRYDSRSFRT